MIYDFKIVIIKWNKYYTCNNITCNSINLFESDAQAFNFIKYNDPNHNTKQLTY